MASSNAAVFITALGVYLLWAYTLLTTAIRYGKPWLAMGAAYLAGPVPMIINNVFIERRELDDLLRVFTHTWGLTFADFIALPAMAAVLAVAWKRMPEGGWYRSQWWFVAMLSFGLVAGCIFHLTDIPNYTALAIVSTGKLLHDFVVYAALSGGLMFGLVPALLTKQARRLAGVAFLCLVAWASGVGVDMALHHFVPTELHNQWDYELWRVIPY